MLFTTKNAIVLSNQDMEANPAHPEVAALCPCKSKPSLGRPQHSIGSPSGKTRLWSVSELRRQQTRSSGLPELSPIQMACGDISPDSSGHPWKLLWVERELLSPERDSQGFVHPTKLPAHLHSCVWGGEGWGLVMCRCWA